MQSQHFFSNKPFCQRTFGIVQQHAVLIGAVILSLCYTAFYFHQAALPGNTPEFPMGWWGWWDQGQYIKSARALAAHDFAPSSHWYPLGYSILAVPFVKWMPANPFYFIDLACLLLCYFGFIVFARHINVTPLWATLVFFISIGDPIIFQQWAIPWSTTPTAALTWLLLGFAATHIQDPVQNNWRLFLMAMLAMALPLMRPAEASAGAVIVGLVMAFDCYRRRLQWGSVASVLLGGVLVLTPYLLLHWHIYKMQPPDWLRVYGNGGLNFHDFGWKFFVIFIDPRQWFDEGVGILQHSPWIALAFAGIVPALLIKRPEDPDKTRSILLILVCCLLTSALIYLSYVPMFPDDIWRYYIIHYWKWTFPGFGLLAFLFLRHVFDPAQRRFALGSLAITLLLLSLRVVPVPLPDQSKAENPVPAKAVDLPGQHADSYITPKAFTDKKGIMTYDKEMRPIPYQGGIRLFGLRREIEGDVTWVEGLAPEQPLSTGPTKFWGERVESGYPCWLPPYPCYTVPAFPIGKAENHLSTYLDFTGWSDPEQDFRWSLGKHVALAFMLGSDVESVKRKIIVHFTPLDSQHVIINLNGKKIYDGVLEKPLEEISINIPEDGFIAGKNRLDFDLPDAHAPGTVDTRVLAIAFRDMLIE